MPNPLDALKSLWGAANTSLVPEGLLHGAQDLIDSPSLERSPMEARIRGFGAGALEGLANQITPMNVALQALGTKVPFGALKNWGGAARGAEETGSAMSSVIHDFNPQQVKNMEAMYQEANPVFRGMQEAGEFSGPRTTSGIGASYGVPKPNYSGPMKSLGELDPSMTPMGGEELFNAGQPPMPKQGLSDVSGRLTKAYSFGSPHPDPRINQAVSMARGGK